MTFTVPAALLAFLAASPGAAGEKTYYFGSADRHTTIQFESKSSVGTIVGRTNKISGSATIDFEAGTGKTHVTVPVLSMTTGVTPIDNAMFLPAWMDAKQFPTLEFKAEKAACVEKPKTWKLDGQWTMHGITKDLSITVAVIRIPPEIARRGNYGEGDWIRVKTQYVLKLSDHGIKVPEKSAYTVDDAWTVTVEIFSTTEKPKDGGAVVKAPDDDMPRVARPEKVDPPEGAGKRYKFGKKPQFTNIVAESVTDVETVVAQSKILGGWLVADLEKGAGKVKVSSPVKMLKTGVEERDKLLLGPDLLDGEKFPHLRFESTEASRKDDKTWQIRGSLEIHGTARPVACEAVMRKVTAEQMAASNWGTKDALGFATTFKVKLSDYGIKAPGNLSDEWTLKIDLLAEAEE